jgi:hypothetical protein
MIRSSIKNVPFMLYFRVQKDWILEVLISLMYVTCKIVMIADIVMTNNILHSFHVIFHLLKTHCPEQRYVFHHPMLQDANLIYLSVL